MVSHQELYQLLDLIVSILMLVVLIYAQKK